MSAPAPSSDPAKVDLPGVPPAAEFGRLLAEIRFEGALIVVVPEAATASALSAAKKIIEACGIGYNELCSLEGE